MTPATAAIFEGRPSGPLGLNERGLFRASFSVSAADLTADGVELRFGKLAGSGQVFLDGERIGPAGDARASSTYDVRSHLAPGRHTVAVALANFGGAAGVNDGAELRFYQRPPPPTWSRSTFNGLAQVIVGTTNAAGALELSARVPGLTSAALRIEAAAAKPRPFVK